jgi:predicted transcriptional regulator
LHWEALDEDISIAGLLAGRCDMTPKELAGVDRGLRAAAEGRFANEQEVEAAFAKFRARRTD